jgi:hypothetical protein
MKQLTPNQGYTIIILIIITIVLIFIYDYLSNINRDMLSLENFCIKQPQYDGLTVKGFEKFLRKYKIDIPCGK